MNTKHTFILFGQAGQNVAQGDGRFGRRLRKAFAAEYCTADQAMTKLMRYAFDEGDNYDYNDEGTAVVDTYGNVIIERDGRMSYEHDSRTWEFIALADLDETDAAIVLQDNVLFSDDDKEALYVAHPALRPVEETTEED